jgi:hypothetical protein
VCAISHSKNGLRCASHLTSGRQHWRSPRGRRSPFPIAPRTPLFSQSNWQTFFPAQRRRPSISLSDIRFPAAKFGIITAVETTTSKSCAKVPKANKETVVEKPQESSLADLRRQLEQVVKPGRPSETVIGILAQQSRRDSPIHNLDYLNLVGPYVCLFYKVTYSDVDVLQQLGEGPDKVPEHSDLILRSHSASSIEELLSTSHSPALGGSPHRSSSPFAKPRVYGRVPATASDDELQRSGSATPTGPPMRRLASTPPTSLLF